MRKRNRHRNRANELGEDQFKIVSEKYVPYVDMDIEMGDKLREDLLFYARQNILNDEDALLNWAFVKALETGIKYFEQNEEPKWTEHAYCLICHKEIPTNGGQVCSECTERGISHLS